MGCLRAILIVFCILILLPFLLSACSMAVAIAFPPIGQAYANALHQFGLTNGSSGTTAWTSMAIGSLSLLPMLFIALVIIALLRLLRDEPGQAKTTRRQSRSGRGQAPGAEEDAFTSDETSMIQELHQGFSRMEERVEALETILIDAHRHRK